MIVDDIMPSDGSNNGMISISPDGGTQPYSFNWLDEDELTVSNEEDPDNLAPGIYQLILSDANGCTFTLDSLEVTLNSSTEEVFSDIKIYPNPSRNILNITSTGMIQGIKVFNAQGNLVEDQQHDFNLNSLDVSLWAEGVYILQLNTGKSWINKKVIIMH